MDSDKYNQILQIARLYYIDKIPQNKIAEQEGLSKAKVNRLIKKAHELDFIKIKVEPPEGFSEKLENSIRFGHSLKKVKIINRDQKTPSELINCLNQEFLNDLSTLLREGDVFSLSWTENLDQLLVSLNNCNIDFSQPLSIVEINASINPIPKYQNSTLFLSELSKRLKAESRQICSPLYMNEKKTTNLLKQDVVIKPILDMAEQSRVSLLSIRSFNPELVLEEGLTEKDLNRLLRKDPIGIFCGHFINKKGKVVDNVIDQKIIGLDLNQIKALYNKVLISYNTQDVPIIKALLTAQLIDYLYISDDVADKLN